MKRYHLIIRGRVQGVFYRATAIEQAHALGISGWVRNAADGSVVMIVEGSERSLEALLRWCNVGPPGAYVEQVECVEGKPTGEFHGFHARS